MPFTGKAIYDTDGTNTVFNTVAEDVSDVISMISPFETPLLDALAQAPYPARNVLHEWLEDSLTPNTLTTASAITSTTADTAIGISGGAAGFMQVGAVLIGPDGDEYMQISAISGNTITVNRAVASTSANSAATAQTLSVVSDAALEGADVSGDISRPRVRRNNYCQIFKKDLIVSGTVQHVTHLGGITDEMDYQKQQRMRESLRDLEKAVIRGKALGNTLGSASAYRTMDGIITRLTTNAQSVATLTESWLGNILNNAWDNGGSDIDVLCVDANWKRIIDNFNTSRVRVVNDETVYRNLVTTYESVFGVQKVVLSRWMPANSMLAISSRRVHVVPLQGRSYQYVPVARTGDAEKGMVVGEYTVCVKNEEGMSRMYAG
jgi:hypothetical protein